jgi:hypothetical protein
VWPGSGNSIEEQAAVVNLGTKELDRTAALLFEKVWPPSEHVK